MRIRGHVIGALATTAMRRSVIFRSEGLELVLVFCTAPSNVSSAQKAAPMPAASDPAVERRKLRRPVNFMVAFFMSAILRDILIVCPPEFHSKETYVRVGVFTALLAQMPLDAVIAKLKGLGISTVELGTGNYPGDPHCKLSMLEDKAARNAFKQLLDDNGVTISALSCHGNPLHPDPAVAKRNQEVSKRTILLAEKLGVPVVIDFSGCPGDSDKAKYPNWVTCPWPPEYLDVLAWQWDKKVA